VVEGDHWVVGTKRLAGHYVAARVGTDGSWVELTDVGFAAD
jgi:hypothetical protein